MDGRWTVRIDEYSQASGSGQHKRSGQAPRRPFWNSLELVLALSQLRLAMI